ncbi:hypothetical protein Svir_17410 [Saccharomonospora viridis DSM 43017]|uniref:DUF4352 domain-containing protein n=2 Tax=Saccharomonospora viridis TaxID=1852 RepID=C7MTN5_SACVD|nr:hypothetical protein Svir_17410 [Saccharomonospora viridis DSM 43017]
MDGDHPEDLQKDRNPKLMNSPRRNATTMGDPMRRLALTALFCVLLATSACAEDQASAGSRPELPEESSAETTTQEDKDEPETNERGNIPKKLKEEAGLIHERGDSSAVFAIDEIKVDPECHEYGVKPDKGHTLLLHVRVATGVEADANDAMSLLLNPYNFAELGSDGVTSPASSGMCTDPDEYLPMQFGMNQKYRGTIEVVVPEASGTLILTNYGGRGWEWTYPTDEK